MTPFARLSAILFLTITVVNPGVSQDTQFVRKHLMRLCGPEMHGRGYYKRGDSIAAFYMADQFKQMGIKSFPEGFIQRHQFNVNIINEAELSFNGKPQKYAQDFVVSPQCGSISGTFKPVVVNQASMKSPEKFIAALNSVEGPRVIVMDSSGLKNPELYRFVKGLATQRQFNIAAVIEVFAQTPGSYPGRMTTGFPHIMVGKRSVPDELTEVTLNIRNDFQEHYPTQNVIGYLPGQTDQFIVFTAHYDGYGSFGEGNYYPAAEDNASGTAMVMDLARHYKESKPYYSVAFMLFSGEEVGLMGSKYYVEHPLFPLDKIKLVINLDMVMTGQDGVILFGGTNRPNEASIVQKINEENQYMKNVDNREGTANSDHFPFQEKGVPAIFFLTKGPSGRGHGPDDTYDKLPLYAYENLFRLVTEIPVELRKQEVK